MKKIELWKCDKCGFSHGSQKECADCEAGHFGIGKIEDIDYFPGSQYPSRILVKAPDGNYRTYMVEEPGEDSAEISWKIRMDRKRGLA